MKQPYPTSLAVFVLAALCIIPHELTAGDILITGRRQGEQTKLFTADSKDPTNVTPIKPAYGRSGVVLATPPVLTTFTKRFARIEETSAGRALVVRNFFDDSTWIDTTITGYNLQIHPDGHSVFYQVYAGGDSSRCYKFDLEDSTRELLATLHGEFYPPGEASGAAVLDRNGIRMAYQKYVSQPFSLLTPVCIDHDAGTERPIVIPGGPMILDGTLWQQGKLVSGPAPPLTMRHMAWGNGKRVAVYGTLSYSPLPFPAQMTSSSTGIFIVNFSSDTAHVTLIQPVENISIEHPQSFFISPDGSQIVYNLSVMDGVTYHPHVFVSTVIDPHPHDLGRGLIITGEPSKLAWPLSPWSNSGGKILFLNDTLGALFTSDITGCSRAQASPTDGFSGIDDAQWMDLEILPPEITIVDPVPDLLDPVTGITTSHVKLSAPGHVVTGIAADGVARVLIRVSTRSSSDVMVRFSLDSNDCASGVTGNGDLDGSLSLIDRQSDTAQWVAMLARDTDYSRPAYAIYRAPLDFARPGTNDANSAEREITLAVIVGGENHPVHIRIVRPPVMLIHGLWSSPIVWDDFAPLGVPGGAHDARFNMTRADYGQWNDNHIITILSDEGAAVTRQYEDAVTKWRATQGVASAQVDVVAHSLGGILSRSMSLRQPTQYFSPARFGAGLIHKLITLDSPHLGSEYADLLALWKSKAANDNETGLAFAAFERAFYWREHHYGNPGVSGYPISSGAIDDLRTTSQLMSDLNTGAAIQQQPPVHTFVSTASVEQQILNSPAAVVLLQAVYPNDDPRWLMKWEGIYGEHGHDLVVADYSQQGLFDDPGLRITPLDSTTHSKDWIHDRSVVSAAAGTAPLVIDLLNAPRNGNAFSTNGRAPIACQDDTRDLPLSRPIAAHLSMKAGDTVLSFTSPSTDLQVNDNDSIDVAIGVKPGHPMRRVYLFAPGITLVDTTSPFSFHFGVGGAPYGEVHLAALGVDTAGATAISTDTSLLYAEVRIQHRTTARLDSLRAGFDRTFEMREHGVLEPLPVVGFYSDGGVRNLTALPSLAITTSDSAIVRVDSGMLRPLRRGVVQVMVESDGKRDTITVTVHSANHPPVVDAGRDTSVSMIGVMMLAGTASDPDGDQLQYRWTIVSRPRGSAALLLLDITRTPTLTTDHEGDYLVRFTAYDTQGDSTSATVAIHVGEVSAVGNERARILPRSLRVKSVQPDALKRNALLTLELARQSSVEIHIVDILGRTIVRRTLPDLPAGIQRVVVPLASCAGGTYVCRAISPTLGAGVAMMSIIR